MTAARAMVARVNAISESWHLYQPDDPELSASWHMSTRTIARFGGNTRIIIKFYDSLNEMSVLHEWYGGTRAFRRVCETDPPLL